MFKSTEKALIDLAQLLGLEQNWIHLSRPTSLSIENYFAQTTCQDQHHRQLKIVSQATRVAHTAAFKYQVKMSTHKLTTHPTWSLPIYNTMIAVPPTERLPPVPCPQLRSPRPDGVNSPKLQTCCTGHQSHYLIQIDSSLLHRLIKMTWAPN